ncbi:MAG: metal-dependent transcriptional regulator [Propionibacteriaceae bacterium]|nr:metal-dependent transcriptional regulator [Propionibacteriaceae bacterium]
MSGLIDTTEMYLRTIYELLEEKVPPLRARLAERLQQSGPTVSQTVSRMERDGLLRVHEDRHLLLSEAGMEAALKVMRRHRLAERLLLDVVGLEWPLVHDEACKWEHVIGSTVELKLTDLLGDPELSPYGTPIPRLEEPAEASVARFRASADPLSDCLSDEAAAGPFKLVRIGEYLQRDAEALAVLDAAGIRPGADVRARRGPVWLELSFAGATCRLDAACADQLFVAR